MKTRVPLALASLLISIVACNGLPSTGPALSTPGAEAAPTAVPSANVSDVADIVFINGAVITLDDATARAQALAVRGDTILTVGANEEVNSYRGPGTIVIDLAGKTLLPGFIDSHQYRIQKHAQVGVADAPSIIQAAIEQGLTSIHELYVDGPLLDELLALASEKRVVLMCAEAVPWRCHRSLLADAITARGGAVWHLTALGSARPHRLTPFAVVRGTRVTYPADSSPDKHHAHSA